jgi:hypothetical protein
VTGRVNFGLKLHALCDFVIESAPYGRARGSCRDAEILLEKLTSGDSAGFLVFEMQKRGWRNRSRRACGEVYMLTSLSVTCGRHG